MPEFSSLPFLSFRVFMSLWYISFYITNFAVPWKPAIQLKWMEILAQVLHFSLMEVACLWQGKRSANLLKILLLLWKRYLYYFTFTNKYTNNTYIGTFLHDPLVLLIDKFYILHFNQELKSGIQQAFSHIFFSQNHNPVR